MTLSGGSWQRESERGGRDFVGTREQDSVLVKEGHFRSR